jgi:DNA-binding transcriptional regulator YbjK
MAAARDGLERASSFATALQSQINGLTTDFINRDDPAQRAAIEQRRTKAVAELERVQRAVESATKGIAAVEDEARKAGVPAGWLR